MKMDKKILQLIGNYPSRKRELAALYAPGVCPKSAMRLLNAYIHRAHGLLEALEKTGYSHHARHFTPLQLALVLQHLGEPFGDEEEGKEM